MNKSIMLQCLFVSFIMSLALAGASSTCNPNVSLVNQDPYPAIPNSYVKVTFQMSGIQDCNGARFRLVPSYPFSLDTDPGLITLDDTTRISGYNTDWMIPYTLRVDKDALDGNSEIEVRYGSNERDTEGYVSKKFNITVQDSRTSFDAVIQEATSSSVSIAIANTGKYTANSVIVKIPEQDSFQVIGTNGQMVGNLESGDYTIVGFTISSKAAPRNMTSRNMTRDAAPPNFSSQSSKLKFDIYYTDNLGERRIVNMELPLDINSANLTINGGNFSRRTQSSSSSWSIWYTVIIIIIILIIVVVILKKYSRQIKNLLIKKNQNSSKLPDWIRNTKEKGK